MELLPHLTASAAEAARIARGVPAGPLTAATPCTDMDLKALVNHWVLYSGYGLEKRAQRQPLPEGWLTRDFTAEPDWAEAYAAQLDRALAAWSDPAAWEGDVEIGEGYSMPAATIAGMIIKEHLLHGWDVAKASGQEIRVPEDTAKVLYEIVDEHAELFREYKGFADPVVLPADASTFDRALALSGRDPSWTPAA
ncbi:TIGR03086 family metal-binding protein [Yinghuangia soli]|uniref:TIGR03086 family metal-binding protein n=1 Tax=Yinghuangia soli TaxID=2908204 RepID=A0AA41Q6I7_9ACTN|nr:TIGR03086 family metal-binding protein [Yinghuangia soli]MCF2531890.1 TIGR03086 family metal-binding protein [Yinghuangia soli]